MDQSIKETMSLADSLIIFGVIAFIAISFVVYAKSEERKQEKLWERYPRATTKR